MFYAACTNKSGPISSRMISLFPRAFQGFINLGAKMLVYLVENERSKFELLTTRLGLMLVVEKFKFILTGYSSKTNPRSCMAENNQTGLLFGGQVRA